MIRFAFHLALLTALLFQPMSAVAAPSAIRGITVENVGGEITVEWQEPEGESVMFYRVYISSESILENDGTYDRFEETSSNETRHVLQEVPSTSAVHISVMAVDELGEESEFFVEEASVVLEPQNIHPTVREDIVPPPRGERENPVFNVTQPSDPREPRPEVSDATPQDAPAWQRTDDDALHLLLLDVLSATELKLTFSAVPKIAPEDAPHAFRIVDQFDQPLHIQSIVLDQKEITVHTLPQQPGRTYKLELSEPLSSAGGKPLDRLNRQSYFQGYEMGMSQTADTQIFAPENINQAIPPALPIMNLRLRAQAEEEGSHKVFVTWETDPRSLATAYVVRQSPNKGGTFSEPQILDADIAGIEIPGVTSAEYGVEIRVLGLDGQLSDPVFENIHLPGGIEAPPTYTPPPTAPPPVELLRQVPVPQMPLPPVPITSVQPQPLPPIQVPLAYLPQQPPPPPLPPPVVRSDSLAQTGAGAITGALVLSGMCAYLHRRRTQKQ